MSNGFFISPPLFSRIVRPKSMLSSLKISQSFTNFLAYKSARSGSTSAGDLALSQETYSRRCGHIDVVTPQ
jgi:hypothetical protein